MPIVLVDSALTAFVLGVRGPRNPDRGTCHPPPTFQVDLAIARGTKGRGKAFCPNPF